MTVTIKLKQHLEIIKVFVQKILAFPIKIQTQRIIKIKKSLLI
ncbi:MAG: hypothetical protein FNNCIFGK_00968 [Bacteroidia bacterium]|nr:MAG: hypothetical protein UZ10_BCD003001940 [Bacteroidetes bacterium OLB10]MBV6453732.1 hypothetical protein [Bacteroidia bacterium]